MEETDRMVAGLLCTCKCKSCRELGHEHYTTECVHGQFRKSVHGHGKVDCLRSESDDNLQQHHRKYHGDDEQLYLMGKYYRNVFCNRKLFGAERDGNVQHSRGRLQDSRNKQYLGATKNVTS